MPPPLSISLAATDPAAQAATDAAAAVAAEGHGAWLLAIGNDTHLDAGQPGDDDPFPRIALPDRIRLGSLSLDEVIDEIHSNLAHRYTVNDVTSE